MLNLMASPMLQSLAGLSLFPVKASGRCCVLRLIRFDRPLMGVFPSHGKFWLSQALRGAQTDVTFCSENQC